MSFPLDIALIESLLADNTVLTQRLCELQDGINDTDAVETLRRLGVISGRLGLLFSCNYIPQLEVAIEDESIEDLQDFIGASSEYQYQVSAFLDEIEKTRHE